MTIPIVAQAWQYERLQQFVKFCLVGASGLFVDMGVLFLLADPRCLGLSVTLSKICSAEAALTSNFLWNELWTFRQSPSPAGAGESARRAGEGRREANISCGQGRGEGACSLEKVPKADEGNGVELGEGLRVRDRSPSPVGWEKVPEADEGNGVGLGEGRGEVEPSRKGIFRRFLLFHAICGVGIGLSVLLLCLFHTCLGWNLYLSNLLAILLVTLWNFSLNARLNWRGSRSSITQKSSEQRFLCQHFPFAALGLSFCLLQSNNSAGGLPATGAVTSAFEFRGQSRYEVFGTDGSLKFCDTNTFALVVSKHLWHLTLAVPGQIPNKPTSIIDDGTNYFVFAHGSGGTCRMGQNLKRYEDTISVYRSGDRYPLFHGTAPWLLFGCNPSLTLPSGSIGPLFGPNGPANLTYQRVDDTQRNSFGPSLVRIFSKPELNSSKRLMVAELAVIEARSAGPFSISMTAELRRFRHKGTEMTPELMAAFHIDHISFNNHVPLPLAKPEISRPTLITEHRIASPYEYVATSWLSSGQVQELIDSRKVRFHVGLTRPGPKPIFWLLVLIIFVLLGPLVFKLCSIRRDKVEKK